MRAERIEEEAWEMCRGTADKFTTIEDWRYIFAEERVEWEGKEAPSQEAVEAALNEVDAGRERLLSMVRQNTITMNEAAQQIEAGRKEAAGLRRQLDALAHREESHQKMLELLEREVAQLGVIKAEMVNADAATRHDII